MSSVLQHTDYREVLREEFARRSQQNPRYSQGAFARDIRLRPSRLSEILNNKQGLSANAASDVARCLGFNEAERNYFADLVMAEHARSKTTRETARIRLRRYQDQAFYSQLQEDTFKVISDWHHLAIVELTRLDSFRSDPSWIGEALGISAEEAYHATQRLLRLDLLKKVAGRLVATNQNNLVASAIPSASIRAFHAQILEKAREALLTESTENRINHTYIVAVDQKKLPDLRQRLLRLVREIDLEMEASTVKDTVVCLSTQLFELARPISDRI